MARRKSRPAPGVDVRPSLQRLEEWFASQGWTPFPFQREVWARFQAGESGLIHAPTGTGKTYAAYLGALLEAIQHPSDTPGLRVLWLTPLRALASDTERALAAPLSAFGVDWQVESRTADTSAAKRQRQRKRLAEVLVTTPESLSLFLTHDDARERFQNLMLVVVDEWHELLASKRGVQTELALARLRHWVPNVRTWGVSATLGNLDVAMKTLLGVGHTGQVVHANLPKTIVIDSIVPATIERFPWAGHLGLSLLPEVVHAIDAVQSALVFTNTRAQSELWYSAILQAKPEWAGAMALHHGSLDRKVRDWVEDALRGGQLRVVVCTSSLDLGVDFAPVERVLQIGSPKGVGRLIQRAGRSGHQPGSVSRVTLVPTNVWELVELAAARRAAEAGQIEGREPIRLALDVLAQHAVTIATGEGFVGDELFNEVKQTHAFQNLTMAEWDWVLDFITRGGETLKAYPEYRRVDFVDGVYRVTDPRIARRHRLMLGTIVSEAGMEVRFLRGGRLGTVEENFITKLKRGECFQFAGRTLELVRIHELTAWVRLSKRKPTTVPRWTGGRMPLSSELGTALREELERAESGCYDSPELRAARPFLQLQAARSCLPRRDELLIERLESREGHHLFLYPFEGRLVHEGLAALLAYRLSRVAPITFSMAVNDYGLELLSPTRAPWDASPDWFDTASLGDDIFTTLNAVELARRQFREIARVAGLVFPGFPGAGRSAKQWQASTGLLYNVFTEYDPGHLLLHQAKREVLERQLEQMRLHRTLQRLQQSNVRMIEISRATPLAFPLMVERLRAGLSSEKLADRVRRMVDALERDAEA